VGRLAAPRAKEYAGQTSIFSLHKVCGTGQASPRCAGLMRTGPKWAGLGRIVTPNK